jgi:hypothetical protein
MLPIIATRATLEAIVVGLRMEGCQERARKLGDRRRRSPTRASSGRRHDARTPTTPTADDADADAAGCCRCC